MGYAVLFPGQGSQFVGMGADLFAARPDLLGPAADEVLGWSLRDLCLEGPEEELTRTDRAQPALFALSFALWESWTAITVPPMAGAGHSLGEYTALAAAGAFDFFTGLGLVAERGLAMAEAAAANPSGMAALLGSDESTAEAVARARREDGGNLWVANLNAPGQVVLAGGVADLDWLAGAAAGFGVRRVVPLKVSGAFHSPLMEPAAARLEFAVQSVTFGTPSFPIWANASATPYGSDIGALLVRQLTEPVRFTATLQGIAAAGARSMIHIGPGDVTAGLAKRAAPGVVVGAVSALGDIPPNAIAVARSVQ